MTNAQKWVASFLGLFLILFLLGRITQKEEQTTSTATGPMPQQSQQTSGNAADGPTLIKQSGCFSCHGEDLQGTKSAPALANIKQNWTRDGLINYLRNPSSYSGGTRFDDYRAQYKNVIMPSYSNIDVKDLGKIADYLLTR